MEDGHGPLPAGQYVRRVRRFLKQDEHTSFNNQLSLWRTRVKNKIHNVGTNGDAYLDRVDKMVGKPLLPTRTSASRFWNRTSMVDMSISTVVTEPPQK
jgi:hypothetical protein